MEIHSDRRWDFDVPAPALWDAIAGVHALPSAGGRGCAGSRRRASSRATRGECVVQPPLPYTLRFRIALDEVDPHRLVAASLTGDVTGRARLEIGDTDDGCEARLVSLLAPGNGALRDRGGAGRPIARFGHDWVLDTGATQFVARAV